MKMTDQRFGRYREAYIEMARRAKYRPAAPADQMTGALMMSEAQMKNEQILSDEADRWAAEFVARDDAMDFIHGCPNFVYNKAFMYAVCAAQLMCGTDSERWAIKCLEMAIEELKTK